MKKILKLVLVAVLVCAMLAASTVVSSAVLFDPGRDGEKVLELQGGTYSVVVESIGQCVFKLWGFRFFNLAFGKAPIKAVTVNGGGGNTAMLSGGRHTLAHIDLTVNEAAKEIRVAAPQTVLWLYAADSVTLTVNVPVRKLAIDTAGSVKADYQNVLLSNFEYYTNGRVTGNISFAAKLEGLTTKIASAGEATFTGEAAWVNHAAEGFSRINAYGLKTESALINASGSSVVQQYFVPIIDVDPNVEIECEEELPIFGELAGSTAGGAEIWYDFQRYHRLDVENLFPYYGPTVTANFVLGGTIKPRPF